MKKLTEPLKERIFLALQAARHTPNDQGVTPAELMHGWRAVTQFDRIKPRSADKEGVKDPPVFGIGQHIWYRVYGRRDNVNWAAGTIVSTMALKFTLLLMSRDTWWGFGPPGPIAPLRHIAEPPPDAAGPADPPFAPPPIAEPPPFAACPALSPQMTTPPPVAEPPPNAAGTANARTPTSSAEPPLGAAGHAEHEPEEEVAWGPPLPP